jgi:CDP-paratose 2-epimerase
MPAACFRGGTLTGPQHSATQLHGFLGYVMRCTMSGTPYTVFGYKGKQVRDAIHSHDLVTAFERFWRDPRGGGQVYNIGGGRTSHCSVLEAIDRCEQIAGRELDWTYDDTNRVGDHIWWVGSNAKFESHYPGWSVTRNVDDILTEMFEANAERWATT